MNTVKLLVLLSNDIECANLYSNTGAVVAPQVQTEEVWINLDVPEGWSIRSIDRTGPSPEAPDAD